MGTITRFGKERPPSPFSTSQHKGGAFSTLPHTILFTWFMSLPIPGSRGHYQSTVSSNVSKKTGQVRVYCPLVHKAVHSRSVNKAQTNRTVLCPPSWLKTLMLQALAVKLVLCYSINWSSIWWKVSLLILSNNIQKGYSEVLNCFSVSNLDQTYTHTKTHVLWAVTSPGLCSAGSDKWPDS